MKTISRNCTANYFCRLSFTDATPSSGDSFGDPCPAGAVREIPCPPGQYCEGTTRSSPNGNYRAGYFCLGSSTTATPSNNLTQGDDICPAGYYCSESSSSPIPCSPGTYRASIGASLVSHCVSSNAGPYCSAIGGNTVIGNCSAGHYYLTGITVANQVICDAGYMCPAGSGSQIVCTDPLYQDQKDQSDCKNCSASYICTKLQENFVYQISHL